MNDRHLIKQKLQSEELFKGHFLHALRDTVRLPDGQSACREYLLHPGAVMIVPLLEDAQGGLRRVCQWHCNRRQDPGWRAVAAEPAHRPMQTDMAGCGGAHPVT